MIKFHENSTNGFKFFWRSDGLDSVVLPFVKTVGCEQRYLDLNEVQVLLDRSPSSLAACHISMAMCAI
jgi:hypothetical protein